MKRLLITGGSGYLGQHLVPAAIARYDILYTHFQHDPLNLAVARRLNILDRAAVRSLVSAFHPDAIVHTIGSNRSPDMEKVICEGTANIVDAAAQCGARLIHLSSDVVFDGRHGPYHEDDQVNPLHAYGRAKVEAETLVAEYEDHVIVRTSLIYGLEIMDHSTEWIVSNLHAGNQVTLFDDQWRSPIWAESLSQACLELVELDFQGILHVAGVQSMNRADFGQKLLDWWSIDERATLRVGTSDERWPRDCRLDVSLAQALLTTSLPGVDDVLAQHGGR